MMKMLEKFREYCEFEYECTSMAKGLYLTTDKNFTWYAVQRILGVSTFLQFLEPKISSDEIQKIFEEYKEKLLKIS